MLRSFAKQQPNVHPTTYIDASAIIIGDVTLGQESSVWPQAVIRGDIHRICIGDYTNIQDGSVLHVTHAGEFNPQGFSLTIGNHVTVGHRVILHGCQIADHCLIGMGSTVMDGALIQREVLVGAHSLVPPGKTLESGYVWLGNPVRKLRPLTDEERGFIHYSANYYATLKQKYLLEIATS